MHPKASFASAYIIILSFTSSNVAGHTKKATAAAMVTGLGALGNITGTLESIPTLEWN